MPYWLFYFLVGTLILGFLIAFVGMGWWTARTNSRSSQSSQQWFALTPEAQARERDRLLLLTFSPENLAPRRLILLGVVVSSTAALALIVFGTLYPPLSA